ncbi:efflux RND transporter periplasmic adaptor subunit [Gemmatimonas sp.]|uniref:efflux RND transporter periplasmic adaptor subunit n=1 Tax=Gemmatimonas sp. TaxID=1962908 RepID=UPI0039837962
MSPSLHRPQYPAPPRVLGLTAWLFVLGGCSGSPDANASAPATAVRQTTTVAAVVTVESTTVSTPMRLPSQLYVEQDAAVGARTAGVLRTLSVALGSDVKAGDVLGYVEDGMPRLAVARADVTLDYAKKTAWRAHEMAKSNNIPIADVEDAEYQANLAEVAKREADQALERTRILSPFDGVVTGRYVQPGRLLALHDTIVRVTARRPWLARVRVPESESATLRIHDRLAVVTTSGRRLDGRIRQLAPAIDPASGTREVIVQVDGHAGPTTGGNLFTGSAVFVELPRRARRILAAPLTAVSTDGYVVLVENRRTLMRPVVVGGEFGTQVEVLAGLQAGDRIRARAR